VIAGRKTPEEVFRVFLDSFEGPHGDKDGHVSHQEWTEYYENISASIDNDDYFALMMQNAWKISESAGEFTLDPTRAAHLEETLRSKLLQKKKDRETEARCLLSAFRHFNFGDSNVADARCFARTVEKFGVVLDEAEMDAWFTYYDQEGTGTINYEAFAAALYPDDAIQVRPTGVPVTPNRQAGGGGASPEVWRPSTRQSRPGSAHEDTRPW
jgi:Ca2+-binding EF-hand superfamily protein